LLTALHDYGVQIEIVDLPEWRSRLTVWASKPESRHVAPVFLALCRCLDQDSSAYARWRSLDLFQATDVEFDMTNTLEELSGTGIVCPAPSAELLQLYLRSMLAEPIHRIDGVARCRQPSF